MDKIKKAYTMEELNKIREELKATHTKEMIAIMYRHLMIEGSILYATQRIANKQQFISIVGKTFGYKNVKDIIKEVE